MWIIVTCPTFINMGWLRLTEWLAQDSITICATELILRIGSDAPENVAQRVIHTRTEGQKIEKELVCSEQGMIGLEL